MANKRVPARREGDPEATVRSPDAPLRGRYRLELLRRGGMGCAYRASLGQRRCFVKEAPLDEPSQAAPLRSEAQMLQRLPLGNFPRFVETFEEDGYLYLITELLEGNTMEQEVQRNPWTFPSEDELRTLSLELCRLLEVLHNLTPAVLHLDVKPSNLICSHEGRIYLVDFGISRLYVPPYARGTFEGSPQTASPEHYTGKLDRRSDLFGVAATIHYVATRGQAERALHGPFPSARDYHPALSLELDGWLLKCLSLNPGDRYQDVTRARQALEGKPADTSRVGRSWLQRLGFGRT